MAKKRVCWYCGEEINGVYVKLKANKETVNLHIGCAYKIIEKLRYDIAKKTTKVISERLKALGYI